MSKEIFVKSIDVPEREMSHSARIRNLFDLHIPLSGPEKLEAVPLVGVNFGFALALKGNEDYCAHYHIQLIHKDSVRNEDARLPNCFVWAKRSPIKFQKDPETQQVEGITVRIKLPPNVFDFRKYKSQQTRIQVNKVQNRQIVKQAFSNVVQILPKNRVGQTSSAAYIPVFWTQEEVTVESPESEFSSHVSESSLEEPSLLENSYEQSVYSNSAQLQVFSEPERLDHDREWNADTEQYIVQRNNGDPYMVLFNGNAEVVGNFRALNFYKSSDINIKEDIRLLVENHDCRDTLLQIDGVNYKFKQGVHTDTNRHFVGYIAQQVESVVPEAVQLIDGILHVDYESLIPYLSESVRANLTDIKDLRTKTERIQQTIDSMYEQFIRTNNRDRSNSYSSKHHQPSQGWSLTRKIVFGSLIATTFLAAIIATLAFAGVFSITPQFPVEYRAALKEFYLATNGDTWLRNDNWLDEQKSICDWYGVACVEGYLYYSATMAEESDKQLMIHIALDSNNLAGTLPTAILENITVLRTLNLRNNSLNGTVPDVGPELKVLEHLDLADNQLSGSLPNLDKYPSISSIDLSRNQFSGTISDSFFSSLSLIEAKLSHNQLSGRFPSRPTSSLTVLDLSSNRLSGTIPFISLALVHVNLADNLFEGEVLTITRSPQLTYLNLANNKFSTFFTIPALPNVVYLNISNNELTTWRDDQVGVPNKLIHCDARNNPFRCPFGGTWMQTLCHAECN